MQTACGHLPRNELHRRAFLLHQRRSDVMGIFTKDIKTMEDLLIHGLQDIYYADRSLKRCRK